MKKIKGKCKCGKKIDLYEDRTNGTSRVYVYENENPETDFHIFRCRQCKKCISNRFIKDKELARRLTIIHYLETKALKVFE